MTRVPLAPLVKFLAFALVVALATTVLALTIANAQNGSRTDYSATFTDASGLLPGDDVRIAGVVVGKVDGVEIVDRRLAKVDFSVDSAQAVPASATAAILYKNLIGQRVLSLGQGAGATGSVLAPGGSIPVDRTKPALNLTTLFNGFQPLFTALDPEQVNTLSMEIVQVLQGEGGTIQSLLASTSSLTNSIADRDQVIGQVINNLNSVLDTVNSRDDQLGDLITSLQQLVSGLSQDRKPIGQAIASIGELTQVTGSFVQDARPDLKNDVVALGNLSNQLDTARPTLEQFLQTAPGKLNAVSRAASYGSWFQFYLCGLSGTIGVGDLIPKTTLPLINSPAARCHITVPGGGSSNSAAGATPAPTTAPGTPGLPALSDLPLLGPLLGGG